MIKMNQRLKENQVCIVCQEESKLYHLSKCSHRFCQNCCINYITTKANNFSEAKCLQDGCNELLDKTQIIYSRLDSHTKQLIENYQRFQLLQSNHNLRACKSVNCQGLINRKQKPLICSKCQAKHCIDCFELYHQLACKINDEEQMIKLNLKKCPNCSIWVEKIAGCEYISCKCGIQFCYRCGIEFVKDPCRKKKLWQSQIQIRSSLKKVQIKKPLSFKSALLILPKLIFTFLIVLPLTIISCLVPILIFLLAGAGVLILSPLVLLQPISLVRNSNKRCFLVLLFIIFYPVCSCLFFMLYVLIVFLYPFCRNRYHHGVYDPFDLLVAKLAVIYLKSVVCIFQTAFDD